MTREIHTALDDTAATRVSFKQNRHRDERGDEWMARQGRGGTDRREKTGYEEEEEVEAKKEKESDGKERRKDARKTRRR
jgi:hypothetical protein